MIYAVDEITLPVDYDAEARSFGVACIDAVGTVNKIAFCPFCGASLVEQLGSVSVPFGITPPDRRRRPGKVIDLHAGRWNPQPDVASPHGCAELVDAFGDPDIPLTYCDRLREFRLAYVDPDPDDDHEDDDGSGPWHLINFCPFCGVRLPGSLRRQWFDYFFERGLDPGEVVVPTAMRTGQWWRDAGL